MRYPLLSLASITVLGLALVLGGTSSTKADDYWNGYWNWYDNAYVPYYYSSGYDGYYPGPYVGYGYAPFYGYGYGYANPGFSIGVYPYGGVGLGWYGGRHWDHGYRYGRHGGRFHYGWR